MEKIVTLAVAGTAFALSAAALGAPLPVATNQPITPASNGGCPPGTVRDDKAVAALKEKYAGDSAATEKAIANVPCVASSSIAASGGDTTAGLQPPVSKPAGLQPPGIMPAGVQPPGIKPAQLQPPGSKVEVQPPGSQPH